MMRKVIIGVVLLICSYILGAVISNLRGIQSYESTAEFLGIVTTQTIFGFIIVYGVFYRGLKRGTLLEDLGVKSSSKQPDSGWSLTKIVKYSLVLLVLVIVISVLVSLVI